jgi:hypothetical protein
MNKQNFTIAIVIGVLLAIGIGINYYWEQSQVLLDDDGNPIPKATSQTAPPRPVAPPTQKAPVNAASPKSTALPSEETFGSTQAKTTIGLGYTMDAKTEANPLGAAAVITSLYSWQQAHPDTKVRVVSVDLPKDTLSDPEDAKVPLGLSINGRSFTGLNVNPGESSFTPAAALAALKGVP